MKLLYHKMESTVDSYEKKRYKQDSMSIKVHMQKKSGGMNWRYESL